MVSFNFCDLTLKPAIDCLISVQMSKTGFFVDGTTIYLSPYTMKDAVDNRAVLGNGPTVILTWGEMVSRRSDILINRVWVHVELLSSKRFATRSKLKGAHSIHISYSSICKLTYYASLPKYLVVMVPLKRSNLYSILSHPFNSVGHLQNKSSGRSALEALPEVYISEKKEDSKLIATDFFDNKTVLDQEFDKRYFLLEFVTSRLMTSKGCQL